MFGTNTKKFKNTELTFECNIERWESYLLCQLKETNDCFVEIEMAGDNTVFGSYEYEYCKNIKKSELISLIQQLCNKLNYNYFITTRSKSNSTRHYYIVLSIIQTQQTQKLNK